MAFGVRGVCIDMEYLYWQIFISPITTDIADVANKRSPHVMCHPIAVYEYATSVCFLPYGKLTNKRLPI